LIANYDGQARAYRDVVKFTNCLFASLLTISACSLAPVFADPLPVYAESATDSAVPVAVPADIVPADIVVETTPIAAVTAWQRLQWFDAKTFGVSNLGGSIPGAAWMTFLDRPHEAGPHWEGFAERYGVSIATNAVSNAMEAGLGTIWGEDPRYLRAGAEVPLKSRLSQVVKWTVLAPNRDGELRPAYARFIAFSSSSFISNAWREPSDTSTEHSLDRIAFGFLGRMGSNAFDEFWPDTKRKLFHRGAQN
jgi:hypothetical protein